MRIMIDDKHRNAPAQLELSGAGRNSRFRHAQYYMFYRWLRQVSHSPRLVSNPLSPLAKKWRSPRTEEASKRDFKSLYGRRNLSRPDRRLHSLAVRHERELPRQHRENQNAGTSLDARASNWGKPQKPTCSAFMWGFKMCQSWALVLGDTDAEYRGQKETRYAYTRGRTPLSVLGGQRVVNLVRCPQRVRRNLDGKLGCLQRNDYSGFDGRTLQKVVLRTTLGVL